MKLTINRSDKTLTAEGREPAVTQTVKGKQQERLRIQFLDEETKLPALLAEGSLIEVGLKTLKGSTVILASAADFTANTADYSGWLDLDTPEIAALGDNADVLLEVSWTEDGHKERSDDLIIRIARATVAGTETLPSPGDAAAKAAYIFSGLVCDDDTVTFELDASNGRVIVRSAGGGGGGSSMTYSNGYLSTTIDGTTYKIPAHKQ